MEDTDHPSDHSKTHSFLNGTLTLTKGDLTNEPADAIVNAANSSLMGGGGVDGAIHRAGGPEILDACIEIVNRIGRLPAGEAVITKGGNLPARHVIHTVGPIWRGGKSGERETLERCYRNSLELVRKENLRSVAFPSISTGAYRYPVHEAARVAIGTVVEFLEEGISDGDEIDQMNVTFVLFSETILKVYIDALQEIIPI